MPQALIALGGNLGDVVGAFRRARACLAGQAGRIVGSSRLYQSAPWQPEGADTQANFLPPAVAGPDYYNAACRLETQLTPEQLLVLLHRIEQSAGRRRTTRWAARELDLDIVAYGEVSICSAQLRIPHPRLRERDFVIYPLADIAPDFALPPDGTTPRQLKKDLTVRPDGVRVRALRW